MSTWKKRVGAALVFVLIVLAAGYSWMLWDTRSVMHDVKAVANGEPNRKDEVQEELRRFVPMYGETDGSSYRVVRVARYFTWAWEGEGTVWLYFEQEHVDPEGVKTSTPYPDITLSIEKVDGRWEVVGIHVPL